MNTYPCNHCGTLIGYPVASFADRNHNLTVEAKPHPQGNVRVIGMTAELLGDGNARSNAPEPFWIQHGTLRCSWFALQRKNQRRAA
jgi:hypothetical protein